MHHPPQSVGFFQKGSTPKIKFINTIFYNIYCQVSHLNELLFSRAQIVMPLQFVCSFIFSSKAVKFQKLPVLELENGKEKAYVLNIKAT